MTFKIEIKRELISCYTGEIEFDKENNLIKLKTIKGENLTFRLDQVQSIQEFR